MNKLSGWGVRLIIKKKPTDNKAGMQLLGGNPTAIQLYSGTPLKGCILQLNQIHSPRAIPRIAQKTKVNCIKQACKLFMITKNGSCESLICLNKTEINSATGNTHYTSQTSTYKPKTEFYLGYLYKADIKQIPTYGT